MKVLFMLSSLAMGGSERVLVSVMPYFRDEGITPVLGTLNRRRDSMLLEAFEKTGIQQVVAHCCGVDRDQVFEGQWQNGHRDERSRAHPPFAGVMDLFDGVIDAPHFKCYMFSCPVGAIVARVVRPGPNDPTAVDRRG